ncbi:N-acetylmuramoyl-L-alanine amidase [Corynebacterium sp. H127]|uniref:N-acetylmuramoyl-L-alanine amidase n=1 Tax=Corynebacterium sp. H127 TaxID=3133418 RepID=UPI0030A24E68
MLQRRKLATSTSRPVWAILLSTALVASAAIGIQNDILKTQAAGIDPVSASMETAAFGDGATIVVDDPAVTGQGESEGPRAVKEFTRDNQFSMFALTWNGKQDVAAHFRGQRADGTWTEWFQADPASEVQTGGKNGTELIYIEPTNRVQVSMVGTDMTANAGAAPAEAAAAPTGENVDPAAAAPVAAPPAEAAPAVAPEAPAEEAPAAVEKPAERPAQGIAPLPTNYGDIKPVADVADAGLEAVFIDGGSSAPVSGIDLAADSDGMPKIISRSGWGADESIRQGCQPTPDYSDQVSAITIHHTAGSNNYTEEQSAGIVRGIYQYHGVNLGWCDVGYQSLVDKYGNIFEGRFGGINKPVMGAHAGGFNENTWAISMMGDYSSQQPSAAQIQSVGELAGWRAKVAGFNPKGSDTHISEGTEYSKYAYGAEVTLPNIFAHRDVGTTTCPGDAGYAQMGTIRDIAAQKYANTGGTTKPDTTKPDTTKPDSTGNQPAPVTLDPTAPAAPAPAPASTPKVKDLLGLLSSASKGDQGAALNLAGVIAPLVISYLVSQGKMPEGISMDGGVPKIGGISIADLPGKIEQAQTLSSDPDISKVATLVKENYGAVLGESKGPVQYAADAENPVTFEAYDKGAIFKSPATGTHGVWGAIGDAWAQQGLDAGPLGLPTSDEYTEGTLTRMDFQHGYITYDPATNQTQVHTN